MYNQIIESTKNEMEKSLEFLKKEFMKLKAGKLNPAMIEDLMVEYYGTVTPLKQLANINLLEPRVIVVKPYDKNSIKSIENAANSSDLGLSCNVEKDFIKMISPELTEERRQELVKIVGQKTEEAKIIIRNEREKSWKEIKDLEKNSEITEDDKYKAQEELDKIVSEYNEKIKEMEEKKEKEIMTV